MKKPHRKNKVPQEMFGYKTDVDHQCDHSHQSEEEYGPWSSSFTNSMGRLVHKENEYPDVVSTLDIAPGTNALIVWAEWSTGDSFGGCSRGRTESFGIFTDMASAVALKEALLAAGETLVVTTPDGQHFTQTWVPWHGYFEDLDGVRIDPVVVY